MLGVPTADMARNAEFYDFLGMLQLPEGSMRTAAHGQSPARNRNLIIEQALLHDATHILFLDDDIAFPPDLLTRLLAHDLDIVTAVYMMRNYPHQPIIFDYADEKGRCMHHWPPDNKEPGIVEIVGCGLGACLIKTDVFKKMEKPWIRLGELEPDHWCDDLGFFRRAREAGYKLHCDLSLKVGHWANLKVWPNFIDGKWMVTYDSNGHGQVTFPLPRPKVNTDGTDGTNLSNQPAING